MTFRAVVVEKAASDNAATVAALRELPDDYLVQAEDSAAKDESVATLDLEYSSINYKDALALTGRPGVLRRHPLIAGIDAVGTVESLSADDGTFSPGERVLLNGGGLGESRHGGLSERAVVPTASLIRIPPRFSTEQAAAIGTAGFTAALAVLAIEAHPGLSAASGPVLVTGASGGVGGFAVALLNARGYSVVAATGRPSEADYLRSLGAVEVLNRAELENSSAKPLQSWRWAAVVDSVGSTTLANALAQTRYAGIVAACGLAAGPDLPATVLPFILRAVTLTGINSVEASPHSRMAAWELLAAHLSDGALAAIGTAPLALADAIEAGHRLLAGQIRGRQPIDVRA